MNTFDSLLYQFHVLCIIFVMALSYEMVDPSGWNYDRQSKEVKSTIIPTTISSREMVDPSGWNYDRETKGFKRRPTPSYLISSDEKIHAADLNFKPETKDLESIPKQLPPSDEMIDPTDRNQETIDFKSISKQPSSRSDIISSTDGKYDQDFERSAAKEHATDQCKQSIETCQNEVQNYCNMLKPPDLVPETLKPVVVEQKLSTCPKIVACDNGEGMFMKRFINLLLKNAHLSSFSIANGGPSSGLVDIRVTAEDLSVLEMFGDHGSRVSLRELDTVLSRVINSGLHMSKEYFTWMDNVLFFLSSKQVWLGAAAICIILFVTWLLLCGHPISGTFAIFFMMTFMVSYVMEFYRAVKEAEIEQMVFLKKFKDIPSSCRPDEDRTWWQILWSSVQYKDDDCEKYYSAIMIDPVAKVSPVRVLSNIVADLILGPAGKVGDAVAEYSVNMLDKLPFFMGPFMLPFASIIIVVFLLIVVLRLMGTNFRVNSLLLGVEIGGDNVQVKGIPAPQQASLPAAAKTSMKEDVSPHSMVKALTESSSLNLILMDGPSLKKLLQSESSSNEDLNIMQHRKPIESIQPPEPSLVTEGSKIQHTQNVLDEVVPELTTAKIDPLCSPLPPARSKMKDFVTVEDEGDSDGETPEVDIVQPRKRNIKQQIHNGGGDASS